MNPIPLPTLILILIIREIYKNKIKKKALKKMTAEL
jgi:hypothetical protein